MTPPHPRSVVEETPPGLEGRSERTTDSREGTATPRTGRLQRAGACSGLKVAVPSHTVHGIRGQALYLPVHYGFHTPASDIQIIWLFERPHTMPKYLLGSVNKSVVPDLEYQHKFTMMPPNASLLINPLQFTDEGNYIVKVNIQGNGTVSASQKIQVTVDDPVTKPVVQTQPSSGAVEYVGNMTLTCLVEGGTRLVYQWLKNGRPVHTSSTNSFSLQNNSLHIVPVTKEDIGNYSCLVKNPISEMESDIIMPTIYYGPYGLQVNSDKGLKVGEVFTVDIGEAILFDCSADSYPPNTYSWIRRTDNVTYVIKHGPRLEVASEKIAQKTTDYVCCAYNNVTGRRDETHFTIIITSVVVRNPPANAGDPGSIPGPGRSHVSRSNQAHAPQLLSLHSRARELQLLSLHSRSHEPQLLSPHATTTEALAPGARAPQQEKPPQ
ncbi:HEPACAM family member 2 isoform 9-T10 [Megaptera novaeangliae]